MKYLVAVLPAFLALLGFVPLVIATAVWRVRQRRDARESPITRELLRPPGHSLRQQIDDMNLEIVLYLMASAMIPLFIFVIHIGQSYLAGESETALRIVCSGIAAILLTTWAGWRLLNLLGQRKCFVLGLEGELATGEELNQLMLDGCRVFHDIPFRYGNIDHVVVSRSGVFSVNSKALGKPKNGDGRAEIVVDHPSNVVRLPDREYPIPVEDLEGEAKWLSQHLTSAVGRSIRVEPMLALPGWFVKERIARGPVFVFSPRNSKSFFVQNRQVLDPELVKQVAHQLEQLCRDVEPSHSEKKGWEDRK